MITRGRIEKMVHNYGLIITTDGREAQYRKHAMRHYREGLFDGISMSRENWLLNTYMRVKYRFCREKWWQKKIYLSDNDTINNQWDQKSVDYHYMFMDDIIRKYIKDFDSALDIGTGFGHFYRLLQNMNLQAKTAAIDLYTKPVGFDKIIMPIEKFCHGHYDVITCIDVLQHLVEKRKLIKALDNISLMLNPRGLLFIGTPLVNTDQWYRKCYNMYEWRRYLERAGLHPVAVEYVQQQPGIRYCSDMIIVTK